jgi:hypothetical protein
MDPRRSLVILWPAFLMASVLEMLVFAVVDPASVTWFGAEPLGWPVQAVYTVAFFVFWTVIAISSAITQWLEADTERRF